MHITADKIQVAAEYLREHDTRAMVEDLEGIVRRHLGAALAAAAVVGFVAGRALRNGGCGERYDGASRQATSNGRTMSEVLQDIVANIQEIVRSEF